MNLNWRWPALFIWLVLSIPWELENGLWFTGFTPRVWSLPEVLWTGAPVFILILATALDRVVRGFRKSN